jgi:hypothetical protein
VDDSIVVLDEQAALYLAVNRSGAALWPSLLEGATRGQLEDHLAGAFGLDPPTAVRDVGAFVDLLASKSLLRD